MRAFQMNRSLESRIAAIRAQFVAQLSARLVEVGQIQAALGQSGKTESGLTDVRFTAHKIRGAAQTLGFDRLGEVAGQVETSAEDLLNPGAGAANGGELDGQLAALVAEMQSIISAQD